jgi:hypothetical protein
MLPSPSSSPRLPLKSLTNNKTPPHPPPQSHFPYLPTPPEHATAKRPFNGLDLGAKKRVKIDLDVESGDEEEQQDEESDVEMEDVEPVVFRGKKRTVFGMASAAAMGMGRFSGPRLPQRESQSLYSQSSCRVPLKHLRPSNNTTYPPILRVIQQIRYIQVRVSRPRRIHDCSLCMRVQQWYAKQPSPMPSYSNDPGLQPQRLVAHPYLRLVLSKVRLRFSGPTSMLSST